MMDIDNFKKVNDAFGHDVGDRVLQVVANTMNETIRLSDTVGRWGGEEFLCLVQYVELKDFIALAEKLRMLVEKSFAEIDGQPLHVTITIGAAYIDSSDTPASIIKRADSNLYKGKTEGRNRVVYS